MDTNIKTKTRTDVTEQIRDVADQSASEFKKSFDKTNAAASEFDKTNAAASEAANVMQNSFSSALKGMQDYNSKFMEFTQANAKAGVDFAQRLSSLKSPSEFIALWTELTQQQLTTMAEQTKELAGLAQNVMLATAEPLRKGFTKTSASS